MQTNSESRTKRKYFKMYGAIPLESILLNVNKSFCGKKPQKCPKTTLLKILLNNLN